MTDRALITVTPNDSLDQVLDALRATSGTAVVLEVDERSPLLIGLSQLHRLDEVAQAQGVQVTIASANSKLLNAARVFGLEVFDLRAAPLLAPAPASESPRLLAGQPLGPALADDPEDEEELPEAASALRHDRIAQRPPVPQSQGDPHRAASDDSWDEPIDEPSAPRPVRDAHDLARLPGRYDRYGQRYRDAGEGEDDDAPHTDPSGNAAGWDEDADLTAEAAYDDQYDPRADVHGRRGFGGFWRDVRAWVEARRGGGAVDSQAEFDEVGADEYPNEEGWDEPPYRARPVAALGIDAPDADADDAVDDEGVAPSRARSPHAIGRRRAARVGREHTARLPVITSAIAYDADEPDYLQEIDDEGWPERRRLEGAGRFAVGSLLFTLLIVGTLVAIVLYLLLPTATVTLAARTGQLTTEFRVVVGEIDPSSPDGLPTSARIVVPAKRITVPLEAAATKPATGARLEPDVTAGGAVVLTNPSVAAVSVPRGTNLAATDGRTYVTTEAITIGPADPFGSGAFGSGTVKVAATIRGSGGNAAIGVVQGQLDSGIYYTNKTAPIAGGSDRRIPTISEQDREAAQAAAEEAARTKRQGALAGAIPVGSTPMRDTTGVGNFRVKFSAAVGADGDSVTATVVGEVTTLVYNLSDVQAQARAEAERRLASMAKPGEPIVEGSVQIGAPQLVEDLPGQQTYAVTGGAQTRAVLGSEEERERLAQDLAHKDDTEARRLLNQIPGVASSTIQYQTGPFPERMPWLPSHIQVQVAEAR